MHIPYTRDDDKTTIFHLSLQKTFFFVKIWLNHADITWIIEVPTTEAKPPHFRFHNLHQNIRSGNFFISIQSDRSQMCLNSGAVLGAAHFVEHLVDMGNNVFLLQLQRPPN